MWSLLTGIFIFAGTTGCIHRKPKLPCWVTRPCGDYGEKEYILGVGSGETVKIADDEAIAAVAKHFQVNVKQTQQSTKEYRQVTDENGSTASDRQELSTDTVVSVAMELKGVQIVERHEQKTTFFSLAVLERAPLLSKLDKELTALQARVEELIGLATGSPSKIDSAYYYHHAIQLLQDIAFASLDPQQSTQMPHLRFFCQ